MKDYGYFGKGTDGYVHYMQAFNESQKSAGSSRSGGSGGSSTAKNNSGSIWVIALIIYAILQLIID